MTTSLEEVFNTLKEQFNPSKVSKKTTYYFSLGSSEDEKYTVTVSPEECIVEKGKTVDRADCVLKCTADYFQKLVFEDYQPSMTDFIAGNIKTSHPRLLRELKTYFE